VEANAAPEEQRKLTAPRPGHADLAGCLKYDLHDARYILERASARESAARVAAGAMAKMLLMRFGIEVWSHVVAVGSVKLTKQVSWEEIKVAALQDDPVLRCADAVTEAAMKEEVDRALKTGDTVGGIFEVVVRGAPAGLGTHTNWDERLDGLLAQAVMSLQAVKAVEIGDGMENAVSLGSAVQDPIGYSRDQHAFTRAQNRAGGIEGGISNGQDIVVRGYLKPISTLRRPLESADMVTKDPVKAAYERSDVCVVPAGGVAGEAMVALTIARCFLEKFGGDSVREIARNLEGYRSQLQAF
jgi:chorismate synthase